MRKLGVNIDHVATLRQARREGIPDIFRAAEEVRAGGGDSLTIHLREDRRHINDDDVFGLCTKKILPVNLEMSVNEDIVGVACIALPRSACLVPEKREELTTEGGLDVLSNFDRVREVCSRLSSKNIEVSLFIDPSREQIKAAADCRSYAVELHTGTYANLPAGEGREKELENILRSAEYAASLGLKVHAGHGIDYDNVQPLTSINFISEFNIGYSIICRSVFDGLARSVSIMKYLIG